MEFLTETSGGGQRTQFNLLFYAPTIARRLEESGILEVGGLRGFFRRRRDEDTKEN